MSPNPAWFAGLAVMGATAMVGCSSTAGPTAPDTPPVSSGSRTASSAPVVESHPPGDIPDSQAFVPYRGAGFSVTVPEGWSQSTSGSTVRFSDKYNSVTLTQRTAANAPTPQTARTKDLPAIAATTPGYAAGAVRTVRRPAGSAVLLTYRAQSAPNPVTGKVAITDVERYEFWRAGREVIVTLAAPVGADNVDPWRTITTSLSWRGR